MRLIGLSFGALLLALGMAPVLRAQSASEPAPQSAGDATFAPGEGQAQTATACAACHPATIVTGKRFSEEKWSEVVDQMIDKGAKVSDADYEVIVAYLARTYGEAKGA